MTDRSTINGVILAFWCALSLFDWSAQWAAILLMLNGTLLVLFERTRSAPVPSVALFVGAYLIGYAIPILWFPESLGNIPTDVTRSMAQWALRGFSMFALAYFITATGFRRREAKAQWRGGRLAYASFSYMIFGLVAIGSWLFNFVVYGAGLTFIEGRSYEAGSETVRQILTLLSEMKYAYLFGYLLLRKSEHIRNVHHALFIAVTGIILADIVLIGSKAAIIRPLIIVVLSMTLTKVQRIKWANVVGVAFVVAVCFFSFSVITEYRHIVRSVVSSGRGVVDTETRVESFKQAVQAAISLPGSQRETEVEGEDVAARLGSGAFGLGWIFHFTQGVSPYENPISSLLAPLHALVPRFLWEDKPIFFNSGRYATEYFGWSYGGVSISLLGSLYFAWGYLGILAGMAFTGFLLARLSVRIEQQGLIVAGSVALFTVMFLHLMDVGAEFQPIFANLTRVVIFIGTIRVIWAIHSRLHARRHFESSLRTKIDAHD